MSFCNLSGFPIVHLPAGLSSASFKAGASFQFGKNKLFFLSRPFNRQVTPQIYSFRFIYYCLLILPLGDTNPQVGNHWFRPWQDVNKILSLFRSHFKTCGCMSPFINLCKDSAWEIQVFKCAQRTCRKKWEFVNTICVQIVSTIRLLEDSEKRVTAFVDVWVEIQSRIFCVKHRTQSSHAVCGTEVTHAHTH